MRTEKQRENSRLNGAKSRGPTTTEGKRRSSENAYRHGLFARNLALQLEDKSHLREILAELTDDHQPANLTERGLVETMAIARWKQLRFLCSEKIAIDLQVRIESQNPPDYDEHLGAAFIAQAITHMTEERRSLREINLHSARVNREHDRALLLLLKLQDRRGFKPGPPRDPQADTPDPINPPESPSGSPHCAVPNRAEYETAFQSRDPASPLGENAEPEFPGVFTSCLPDKKITEPTHDPLKTNDLPQVRYTQPGADLYRPTNQMLWLFGDLEPAPFSKQLQSARRLIPTVNQPCITHSTQSYGFFP